MLFIDFFRLFLPFFFGFFAGNLSFLQKKGEFTQILSFWIQGHPLQEKIRAVCLLHFPVAA